MAVYNFTWDYDNATTYIINDTVKFNWLFYACVLGGTGVPPTWLQTDNSNWGFVETPEIKVEDIPEKLTNVVAWDKILIAIDSEDGNKTKIMDAILFKWDKWNKWDQGIPGEMQYADVWLHGIVDPGTNLLSSWSPTSTFTVIAFVFYSDWVRYDFAWLVNQDPWFLAWEEFAYIWVSPSWIHINKQAWFTPTQIESWIIEIWIVRSFVWWPGWNLDIINDSAYFLNDIYKRQYLRAKFDGTNYDKFSAKLEASSTPRQLDNLGWDYIDSNDELKSIASANDIDATELYYNGTDYTFVPRSPLNVDNAQYNPSNSLVAIPSGKFVAHTMIHSTRTNAYFLIYGRVAYDTLSEALSAGEDLWPVAWQTLADVNAVSIIAIKEWETTIREIKDIRHKNGADNLPTLTEWSQNISNTFDGWIREELDFSFILDTWVVYLELEQKDWWDLVVQIDWSSYDLNCTTAWGTWGKARVWLTPWTATTIQENWIYVELVWWVATLKSSTTLPSWDKAIIGKTNNLDIARFTSNWDEPQTSQEYNNGASLNWQGLFMRITERLRKDWPKYISWVDPSLSIVINWWAIDTVEMPVSAGIVYQFNRGTFDELLTPKYVIINHPTTPFLEVDSLDAIDVDANGNTLRSNNDRYGLNMLGWQNSWPVWDRIYVLLPTWKYGSDTDALSDISKFAVTSVSQNLWETLFRIGRVVLKYSTTGSGTITNLVWGSDIQDERGFPLWQGWQGAWSGSASASAFSDGTFEIFNSADPTKKVQTDASAITTATTRNVAFQDKDGTFAYLDDLPAPWKFDFSFPHERVNFTPFAKQITDLISYTPPAWKVWYITIADSQFQGLDINGVLMWLYWFQAWQGRVSLERPLILNDTDSIDVRQASQIWSVAWYEVDEHVDITPVTTAWLYTVPAGKYYIITNMNWPNSATFQNLFSIWGITYRWSPNYNLNSTDIADSTANLPILWPWDSVSYSSLNHNWYLIPTSYIS